MSKDWKPGDVALVEAGCWANRKVALRLAEGWAHTNGVNVDGDGVVSVVRPLVVIDPEDREQVERLILALPDAADWGFASANNYDHPDDLAVVEGIFEPFQTALREFANPKPPKPEEPTGLGAVVEDSDGERWIRTSTPEDDADDLNKPWYRRGVRKNWLIVDAVRIVGEGVQS